jgi:hypothetical protein
LPSLNTISVWLVEGISGYMQGLLDGVEFKQTAYALDRSSHKAALSRFLHKAAVDIHELERIAA